jgi:CDP-diacylglycerol--glycerol-3-phosphate 3-phosphatidyltransferase
MSIDPKPDFKRVWTVPNFITLVRILAVPLVLYFVHQSVTHPRLSLWATIIMALAFITDQIDGYLSRVLQQQTILGEIMDPMADKIIVICLLIQLSSLGWIAAWIPMVLLTREVLVNGLRAFAQTRGLSILPSSIGKLKVYFQAFGIGLVILSFYPLLASWPVHTLGLWVLYAAIALSLWSGYDYAAKLSKHIRKKF